MKKQQQSSKIVFGILLVLSLFTCYILYTKKNCPLCECKPEPIPT